MIRPEELNPHHYTTTAEVAANLNILLDRINQVRAAWANPMTVTSGLRSVSDQKRINPKSMSSKHLTGQAVDIYDPEGKLKNWIMENLDLIEQIGFWFEDFASTSNWTHFQIVPPASGKRFFKP